jgi:hypothetical protein
MISEEKLENLLLDNIILNIKETEFKEITE